MHFSIRPDLNHASLSRQYKSEPSYLLHPMLHLSNNSQSNLHTPTTSNVLHKRPNTKCASEQRTPTDTASASYPPSQPATPITLSQTTSEHDKGIATSSSSQTSSRNRSWTRVTRLKGEGARRRRREGGRRRWGRVEDGRSSRLLVKERR